MTLKRGIFFRGGGGCCCLADSDKRVEKKLKKAEILDFGVTMARAIFNLYARA
jgi:hypothetical protein